MLKFSRVRLNDKFYCGQQVMVQEESVVTTGILVEYLSGDRLSYCYLAIDDKGDAITNDPDNGIRMCDEEQIVGITEEDGEG